MSEVIQREKADLRHGMKLHRMEPGRFGVKIREKDQSAQEEAARLVAFPEDPEAGQKALEPYVLTNKRQETIRPWYATLHLARIRGKKVFVCITIEAVPCPCPRRRKDGSFRHAAGDPGQRSLASCLCAVCSGQTGLWPPSHSDLYAGR